MNDGPMTAERYMEIINRLMPLGWMPIGEFGSMRFRKGKKSYDLSAADLDQLGRIEAEGLFTFK
jgi:hypothetical protein